MPTSDVRQDHADAIRRCPLSIANDHHYRADGSCLCSGATAFAIASSALSSCPASSILPAHWRPDGTCRCPERLKAAEVVAPAPRFL